jgi:hypothetical protein
MVVNSKVRLAIKNLTGASQAFIDGCDVQPYRDPLQLNIVPPNFFLVIPAGINITVADGFWIKSAIEWAGAIAGQGYVRDPNMFWPDGSLLDLFLPTVTIISA